MHDFTGSWWLQRGWWLSVPLIWSPHAIARCEERGVCQFDILPKSAALIELQAHSGEVAALWQIYQNGVPVVIVTAVRVHTKQQRRNIVVKTAYIESAHRVVRQSKRIQKREAREYRRANGETRWKSRAKTRLKAPDIGIEDC